MLSDELVRLLQQAAGDPGLQAELDAAATADDVVRIAADRGITVTVDELASLQRTEVDLTDADLEAAAGGTNAAWYWATAPEFCSTGGRLCTFYAPYCTPA